jgi:hypothetical protein
VIDVLRRYAYPRRQVLASDTSKPRRRCSRSGLIHQPIPWASLARGPAWYAVLRGTEHPAGRGPDLGRMDEKPPTTRGQSDSALRSYAADRLR